MTPRFSGPVCHRVALRAIADTMADFDWYGTCAAIHAVSVTRLATQGRVLFDASLFCRPAR